MGEATRQVVLDTETTGLEASKGHRIIEIGCVEMVNRRITRNNLHLYINPEREVDEGAAAVHGMTWDDLRDKPTFAQIVDQFLDFCRGAEIIIHNASFDTGFLDAELARLARLRLPVLLVHGEQDADVPISVSENAAHLLPDARLVRIPGAAHGFGDANWEEAMRRTIGFLAWNGVLEED